MRQARMIATKDHFILIASSDKIGTELWGGYTEGFNVETTNAIGFLCKGEVSSFRRSSNTWNSYTSASAPLALTRPNFGNFGIASKEASSKFGCILTKQQHRKLNQISDLSNADYIEKERIEKTNESIEVSEKCNYYELRYIYTFEIIHQELIPSDYVSDSEIEIEGL